MQLVDISSVSFSYLGRVPWVLQRSFRICFCLGIFAVFYGLACYNGNKLTFDSMAYLAAAKSLKERMILLNQFGKPYISWPPLYPLILSAGIGWIQPFVFFLHLLCGLGTIYLWNKIAEKVLHTSFWKFFFLLVLSLSTPFLLIFVFVWSEAVFILLLTAYLYFLQQFIKFKARRDIVGAAVLAFLMLLQRNAGIFLLGGAVIGVLLNYSLLDKKQLKYLFLHFLLGVSGFGAWNLYVLILKGNEQILTEVEPAFSLQAHAALVLSEVGRLYVPEPGSVLFGIFILVPCLIFMSYELYREKDAWLRLLMVLLLTYLVVWVIVPAVWVVIPAGQEDLSRFLAVVIPVLHLFVFFFLERRLHRLPAKVRPIVLLLAALWLVYPVLRALTNALLWQKLDGL